MAETNLKENKGTSLSIELKKERKNSMLARVKDVRQALYSYQILLILICKEALLTNELDASLPSVVTNLL